MQVTTDEAEIKRKIDLVIDESERIRTLIQARTDQLKQQSEQMWQDVFAVIDQCERIRQTHPQAAGAA